MKRLAVIAGMIGITLFAVLLGLSGLGDVSQAIAASGWATLIVVVLRAVALMGAGIACNWLYPAAERFTTGIAILLRFIREGVNQLLPVAAVGGDLVGARLATFWRADPAVAGAVTIADVAVQAATQLLFALAGIAILVSLKGSSDLVEYALGGLAVGAALLVAFFVVQAKLGSRFLSGLLRRIGKEGFAQGLLDRLWRALGSVYAAPVRVAACGIMHLAMWFLGALEVYVVLHAMSYPISFAEAVVIESLGQAVRGAAFAVPGGIGVQEGGFIALCALFAVPAVPALALSLVKRVADLVLGLPALAAWQVIEARRAFRRDASATASAAPAPAPAPGTGG